MTKKLKKTNIALWYDFGAGYIIKPSSGYLERVINTMRYDTYSVYARLNISCITVESFLTETLSYDAMLKIRHKCERGLTARFQVDLMSFLYLYQIDAIAAYDVYVNRRLK